MTTKTVLIIGAGATRAEAVSLSASRAQRPPLDGDFFDLASAHDGIRSHLDRVQGFLKSHFSLDLSKAPRPGMEEIFGLIYGSTAMTPLPKGAKSAFSSLCRIYAKVIEETTNWIDPRPKGPLCRLIRSFVDSGSTTILTFNQDIVIEKALANLTAARNDVSWSLGTGYGLKFSGFTGPTGDPGDDELFEISDGKTPSSPMILKPHGSLNWYARTLRQDTVLSQLRQDHAINCTKRKELNTTMQITLGEGVGRRTWYTWPIIVPPILEKGTFLGNALDDIWTAAWDQITQASRIVVYGYSLVSRPLQGQSARHFSLRLIPDVLRHGSLGWFD